MPTAEKRKEGNGNGRLFGQARRAACDAEEEKRGVIFMNGVRLWIGFIVHLLGSTTPTFTSSDSSSIDRPRVRIYREIHFHQLVS
jgi:hypothetical protein